MILEEEIKNAVAAEFFDKFDCTKILGKIDFAVKIKRPKSAVDSRDEYLLWAEAKQKPADVLVMLAQLVLTIGKARTFDEILPPPFLGCFDSEKIAFIPYSEIQDIFYQNDFNWNVAPSNHDTKEFKQVYEKVKSIVENDIPFETYLFYFEKDERELRRFIRENFIAGKTETTKTRIDKNNFIIIYNKWLQTVKPTIQVDNWDIAKKNGIVDADFYLADLLSAENKTLKEKLFVLLKSDHYELDRKIDESGFKIFKATSFSDNQKAHTIFWNKYERPPKEEYWDYITNRRDLLVPQDVRERKGSYFTPQIWVELSQRYIADVLGNDWQDEYYVWDCAAGTGNLLAGLTNKYHIWASTLDRQDVDVMHDRIKNGANLLEDHVFQFDFLNDDFSKLPEGLQKIINSPQLRKRLIIYINPPYKRGLGVANTKWHKEEMGEAKDELFAQFIYRAYCEIPDAVIAQFSTLKVVQAPNFKDFRTIFSAKLKKMFAVPANTFDNVPGRFPVGFFVWNTSIKERFKKIKADIYNQEGNFITAKNIYCYDNKRLINDWLNTFSKNNAVASAIGFINAKSNDFQHNNRVVVGMKNILSKGDVHKVITLNNVLETAIYFAVRKVIPADWLNDRDQFLFPNKKWETDFEFQNDCLAYTLFNTNVSAKQGVNHWIPFTESEVEARTGFESHFMISFLSGKIIRNAYTDLFDLLETEDSSNTGAGWRKGERREFSPSAQAVFDAGRKLWRYYHAGMNPRAGYNVNAGLYDIKEYFQGRNGKGKMNGKSDDEEYNNLIADLRETLQILAKKIEPKVYKYGFLL
jgi:hypothetical protein